MVEFIEVQNLSYLIAALSFAATCTYYMVNLRNTQRNMKTTLETRQAQIFMQYMQSMTSKEWRMVFNEAMTKWSWTDYDDFLIKYGPSSLENNAKFSQISTPWEEMGILMKYGVFDINMLYDYWGGFYTSFFEKFEPIWIEYNKPGGGLMEYAEDLYYSFKELSLMDQELFNQREEARMRRRKVLGLKPRERYHRESPKKK